jgi:hypothetical protein
VCAKRAKIEVCAGLSALLRFRGHENIRGGRQKVVESSTGRALSLLHSQIFRCKSHAAVDLQHANDDLNLG